MPKLKIDFKGVNIGGGVAATVKVIRNGEKHFYYLTVKQTVRELWDIVFYNIRKEIEEENRNKTIAELEAMNSIPSPYIWI